MYMSSDLYGDMFEHLLNWETVIEQRPELPIFQCNYEETIRASR